MATSGYRRLIRTQRDPLDVPYVVQNRGGIVRKASDRRFGSSGALRLDVAALVVLVERSVSASVALCSNRSRHYVEQQSKRTRAEGEYQYINGIFVNGCAPAASATNIVTSSHQGGSGRPHMCW